MIRIAMLATILALLVVGAWTAHGRANQPPRQVVYKVVSRQTLTANATLEKSLNDLGGSWELIAIDKDDYIFKLVIP